MWARRRFDCIHRLPGVTNSLSASFLNASRISDKEQMLNELNVYQVGFFFLFLFAIDHIFLFLNDSFIEI